MSPAVTSPEIRMSQSAWTSTDLAYLAGLLDGEGTLGVYGRTEKGRREYVVACVVANTSTTLMEWLVTKFGGSYKARKQTNKGWKVCYGWSIHDRRKIADLLPHVLPYLVIKKEQAELMLQLPYGGGGKNNHPPEYKKRLRDLRESLVERTRRLNKRGRPEGMGCA
jgi:hypothetical protein